MPKKTVVSNYLDGITRPLRRPKTVYFRIFLEPLSRDVKPLKYRQTRFLEGPGIRPFIVYRRRMEPEDLELLEEREDDLEEEEEEEDRDDVLDEREEEDELREGLA